MKFIEEIVVEEFLPTYRSLLAEALRDRGLTQHEIADHLGISQSAVSKYVHGAVTRNEVLASDPRVQELVTDLADGLASGELTAVQALIEAEVLIRELERGGVVSGLHEQAVPELAAYDDAFAIHDPDSRIRAAERTLSSIRRGVRLLENTSGFTALIPAVGSNLVECLEDASDLGDVGGVPGRILDVKGRATVPADPEFGVSQHVASVLLAAREAGSPARAALNLAYDDETVAALRERDLGAVEFDSEDDLSAAVQTAVARDPGASILFHTGAFGIEPIVYVLGPDAVTVAERVREIT